MKAGRRNARGVADLGQMAFTQCGQLALQRKQVRGRLGVHHHQVAGHTAPGPQPQRLCQRAQQTQRARHAGGHQQQRPVARNTKAPQHAAVTDHSCLRRAAGLRPGKAERDGSGERLDGGEILHPQGQRAQADAGQRGRHQRGPLHVAGLAVLIDHRAQRAGVVGRSRGKG